MPKIVDHEERRKELADAVLAIVARIGINGVTMRAVAEQSGWSTGILSHYYGGRRDLLLGGLRRAAALTRREYQRAAGSHGADGGAQLQDILESILPLDASRLALTRIFLFFYAEAAADDGVRDEIAGYLANWRQDVERAVRLAQEQGRLRRALDVPAVADDLVALTDGMSMHAIFDDEVMARLRKRSPVDEWIRPYLEDGADGGAGPRRRRASAGRAAGRG